MPARSPSDSLRSALGVKASRATRGASRPLTPASLRLASIYVGRVAHPLALETTRKSSSITATENPRRPYVAELRLEPTRIVRGSSRRITTMCARSGAIHEYQSDQSSVTGLDDFLVVSSQIHPPPTNENLDGSLHTRDAFHSLNFRAGDAFHFFNFAATRGGGSPRNISSRGAPL